jgi:hypothetical protein
MLKKKLIVWHLPFWKASNVRHAIDMMHLTKNIYINILGFLGTYRKDKDTLESQKDLKATKQQEDLHLEEMDEGQHYHGPVSYTLSKKEKDIMFKCLNNIQVLAGTTLM